MSEPLKGAIRNAITKQSNIGEHALSSLLYGLGKLSRKWTDLHPDVRLALKMAIVVCHINNKCTPQGVANSLYGTFIRLIVSTKQEEDYLCTICRIGSNANRLVVAVEFSALGSLHGDVQVDQPSYRNTTQ